MSEMFKKIGEKVCVFDLEYVPDFSTIRRVYKLAEDVSDVEALEYAYQQHGATAENPKPMLKLFFYKIVTLSAIIRTINGDGVKLQFFSLPAETSEAEMIQRFLQGVGKNHYQLVGYGVRLFDLSVLFQRGLINGITAHLFCQRPDKPWEGRDYFAKFSDDVVDLLDVIGGIDGRSKPKLDEIALSCGIPGKIGMSGADVADAWQAGRCDEVRAYNECDVATTYALWLRVAKMAGKISTGEYEAEMQQFLQLLADRDSPHLAEWMRIYAELNEMSWKIAA